MEVWMTDRREERMKEGTAHLFQRSSEACCAVETEGQGWVSSGAVGGEQLEPSRTTTILKVEAIRH